MSAKLALLVDDEPDIRELLDITLGRMNIHCHAAENLAQARALLQKHPFDLCLTDMRLPDGNGLDLVKLIQEHYSHIPVAVITAHGSVDTAISALKSGAFDFISKPVDLQRLRDLVETALKLETPAPGTLNTDYSPILGCSSAILELKAQIEKLARSQAPVYIWGESGSGKELAAKQIHQRGPRAGHPFIAVNCGAIPTELMESEFFGHKKGSFTGAHSDKEGLFQAAHKGTLFLDEVADLPLHMQVKLLRVIQEKSVKPIGSPHEIAVDVRILSATHKNLHEEVQAHRFRQDLFYRINVIQLNVPSLRQRKEDIPQLTAAFLKKLAQQNGLPTPQIEPAAQKALNHFDYPGNIRELENILERALTLSEAHWIKEEHLQLTATHTIPVNLLPQQPSHDTNPTSSAPVSQNESLEDRLISIEKQAILKVLEETRWNRTAAAKKLGMSFRSLRYRLKKLGLDQDE
jgi:two-component system response regulator PilR (NtrC family)